MQHVARWFLESVGLRLGDRHDPVDVANRWGFRIRPRREGSKIGLCRYDTIWIDPDLRDPERSHVVAMELAYLAMIIHGERVDADALAGAIFDF